MADLLRKSWKDPKKKSKKSIIPWQEVKEKKLDLKNKANERKRIIDERKRKKREYCQRIQELRNQKNNNK